MRLSKSMRAVFVNAVMADTPKDEYREERQKLLQTEACAQMPPAVRAIYNDPNLRHHLDCRYEHGVMIYATSEYKPSPLVARKIKALRAKVEAAYDKRQALRRSLANAAAGAATTEALAKAMPEFAKYLPSAPAQPDRTVPVLTNVVADFRKAGWPKGEKKAQPKRSRSLATT